MVPRFLVTPGHYPKKGHVHQESRGSSNGVARRAILGLIRSQAGISYPQMRVTNGTNSSSRAGQSSKRCGAQHPVGLSTNHSQWGTVYLRQESDVGDDFR